MYNERKDNFSIRDIVLQILFVIIFIFALMWLFPSKDFVTDSLAPLYDRIFADNIVTMKDAAKAYYTDPRLPQEVGDKVKMTLGEMEDKKLIIPFVDSSGNSCDKTASYVEITKMEDEYIMKVNLKCGDQENYILVYMGCYTYCNTYICEKDEEDVTNPEILPTNPTVTPSPTIKPGIPTCPACPDPTPENPNPEQPEPENPDPETPDPETPKPEYICKYEKVVDAKYTEWSSWSDWTTTPKYEDSLTDVETKQEVTYVEENVHIGDKVTTKTITYEDKNKPIYENKQVIVGYENKEVCTKTETQTVNTGNYIYGEWVETSEFKDFGETPTNTNTVAWVWVGDTYESCGNCSFGMYKTYQKLTRSQVAETTTKEVCVATEIQKTPIYGTSKVIVGYGTSTRVETTTTPIYYKVEKPVYTTNYRFRTRTLTEGWRDEVWSECNDESLLDDGYEFTGEKKEK